MKDIAFLSNGHGEDTIACKVIDEMKVLRPSISIDAWPMVGEGAAFADMGIPTFGARNRLPSAGFATVSPKLMFDDLRAGWISTHWQQFLAARNIRGRYRFAVAVGDIIPIVGAVIARLPFVFIGCAKSAYYNPGHGYNAVEKALLRRYCQLTLPRDQLTANELDKAGIQTRYLGNPMMDGLDASGARLGIGKNDAVIGMLAGTRADAEYNLLDLLASAAAASAQMSEPARLRFVFAARPRLDEKTVVSMIAADQRLAAWSIVNSTKAQENSGIVLHLACANGAQALVVKGHFADVLQLSSVVVGMAGTANEQAVGLGKPLITVPSTGVQGEHYVRMKKKYFGDAAISIGRDPDALAGALTMVLGDAQKRQQMAAAGRERMGEPGASRAIAETVLAMLNTAQAGPAAQ